MFQFVHLQNFSRKGDRRGRSTAFVLGEAVRRPEASGHVSKPCPPVVVFGLDVEAVEAAHDAAATAATTTPKGGKPRKVRSDQHTLCTVVMSHPYTMDQVRADPAKRREAEAWERRNVAWLKRQFGDCLTSVVRHEDEAQYHLHAFVLPPGADMRASALHPGQVAKAVVMSSGPLPGEDDKALNRRGDLAYRKAMREWQDAYFRDVAAPSGLSRLGPARRRLTRAEWQAEKTQAKSLQVVAQRAEAIKRRGQLYINHTKSEAATIQEQAERVRIDAGERLAMALEAERKAQRAMKEAGAVVRTADRFKGLGGRLRALWEGLFVSKIREVVRREFQADLDRLDAAAKMLRESEREERRRRREAEQRASAASMSVVQIAAQRSAAWREVNELRSALEPERKINRERGYTP